MPNHEQPYVFPANLIIHEARRSMQLRHSRFLIAIDGGSGSGKSTIAALVAHELDAILINCDDFFVLTSPMLGGQYELRWPVPLMRLIGDDYVTK